MYDVIQDGVEKQTNEKRKLDQAHPMHGIPEKLRSPNVERKKKRVWIA